jgi:hypothetical protein
MGLFNYRPPPQLVQKANTLQERWYIWTRQETLRRLAYAVYEYDSALSNIHNNRPYVTVGDMLLDLPSSAAHWEAETPQSWAALHTWDIVPSPNPFREMIEPFFQNVPLPMSNLAEDCYRQLLILTFIRMLWTMKEIKRSPLCGLGNLGHWLNNRHSLLRRINMLQEFPYSTATTANHTSDQLVLIAQRAQVVHLANFYGAGDLMDLVYRLVRPSSDNKAAERGLIHWAKQEPTRVRETMFHAAQTLALVRHFPSNTPLESFNVFHAGIVLWSMCTLFPQTRRQIESQSQTGSSFHTPSTFSSNTGSTVISSIRLDHLSKQDNGAHTEAIQQWIQTGSTKSVSIFGIPDLCDPAGQIRVLELSADILKNMTVWGVAQSLRRVLLELRQRQLYSSVVNTVGSIV